MRVRRSFPVCVLPLILLLSMGFYASLVWSSAANSWLSGIRGCPSPFSGEEAGVDGGVPEKGSLPEAAVVLDDASTRDGANSAGATDGEPGVRGAPAEPVVATAPAAPAAPAAPPPSAIPAASVSSPPVPVLMYHVIGDNDGPLKGLYVSKEDFAAQVRMLKEEGYETISMCDLLDHLKGAGEIPAHPIVITFDDGYESVYHDAYPILKEAGYTATVFLQTNFLGKPGALSEDAVREMLEKGFDLGAHTASHPDLTRCTPAQLEREVAGSRKVLEETFGVPVLWFAYPAGRYDETVLRAVDDAGYLIAFTTKYGFVRRESAEALALPRIRVDRSDGADGLRRKLHASGRNR